MSFRKVAYLTWGKNKVLLRRIHPHELALVWGLINKRFECTIGLEFLFMDDNATSHRTVASTILLDTEDIPLTGVTARYPDLNPVEYVWDILGRHLVAHHHPLETDKASVDEKWTTRLTTKCKVWTECKSCINTRYVSYVLFSSHRLWHKWISIMSPSIT